MGRKRIYTDAERKARRAAAMARYHQRSRLMAKANKQDPKIEDFLRRTDKRRTGRRSITIWISADIIEACQPQPGTKLREWIEKHWRKP